MIKCPNCGSTAQVKIIKDLPTQFLAPNREDKFSTQNECGCGCKFTHSLIINYKTEQWREEYSNINAKT
jgi:hypothetical protein